MTETKKLEKAATDAIFTLRRKKFQKGLPFMINAKELPPGECYLEYPDGKIILVTMTKNGKDFITIRELSENEQLPLRKQYHLV